ncbi:Uncharacterized protein DAT39_007627, partial [Clarias magur]
TGVYGAHVCAAGVCLVDVFSTYASATGFYAAVVCAICVCALGVCGAGCVCAARA